MKMSQRPMRTAEDLVKAQTVDFDTKLIFEVQDHALIYDDTEHYFRNSLQRHKVWAVIANTLGSDIDTCRRRWKSLRDSWTRHRRYLQSGIFNSKRKPFEYYDLMLFLDPKQRERMQNDDDGEDANLCTTTMSSLRAKHGLQPYSIYENEDDYIREEENSITIEPKLESVDLTIDEDIWETECPVTASTAVTQSEKSPEPKPSSSYQNETFDDDECHIAGRRIGFQLKSVDNFQRIIAEKLISDIVYHGKMGNLSEHSIIVCDSSQLQGVSNNRHML